MRVVAPSLIVALCFLKGITVSVRLKSKAISLHSMRGADDVSQKARETNKVYVKDRQISKRIAKANVLAKHKRGRENVTLEMKFCQPYPTIVQVTEPDEWANFYLPSFVELHRCLGGCMLHPRIGYCAVAKEENITVFVTVHQHQRLDHQVVMSNHTACSCACVPKKCSPWKRFDADLCTCVCINDHDKNSCNEKDNKQWDRKFCRCVCSITYNCGLRYNFNTESCQCEPDKHFIHEISGRL